MDQVDWELLGRYAADECTVEERADVEGRLATSAAYRSAFQAVGRVTAQANGPVAADYPASQLPRLHAKITALEAVSRRSLWRPFLKYAAVLLLTAGGSLVGYRLLRTPGAGSLATTSPTVHTITTPRGQRMALRLGDGTQVVLAPASTLRFSAEYGRHDRTVQLDGEAVFTVTHDERRPFVVRTSRLVARDLGTKFVVRAYAEDSVAHVVVAEGEVAAQFASDTVVLSAGDGARVTSAGRVTTQRGEPMDEFFGWTDARLVFRRTPLEDAIRQIERWHDVKIVLASPELGRRGFTAVFETSESASDVLHAVATLLRLEVVQTGSRSYTLRASDRRIGR